MKRSSYHWESSVRPPAAMDTGREKTSPADTQSPDVLVDTHGAQQSTHSTNTAKLSASARATGRRIQNEIKSIAALVRQQGSVGAKEAAQHSHEATDPMPAYDSRNTRRPPINYRRMPMVGGGAPIMVGSPIVGPWKVRTDTPRLAHCTYLSASLSGPEGRTTCSLCT
eukprot:m.513240 g.513240  ORF g.513240 m.513240 type:complete len:168 (+) comp21903_c0_seq8:1360-1863(+)